MEEPFWNVADAASGRIEHFTRSLALIIGINDYSDGITPLTTAVNDARRLEETLRLHHGYNTHLLIKDVTKARLVHIFAHILPNETTPDDRLLVYFAGHGVAVDGDDGPAGYLLPQNATRDNLDSFLNMSDVYNWLSAESMRCNHLLVILDCCFAGAFRWAGVRALGFRPSVMYRQRYDRFLRSPAWQMIASAAHDQYALDAIFGKVVGRRMTTERDGEYHSPFALALFDGIKSLADKRGDGVITATELSIYLRDEVEMLADNAQTPQLWPMRRHDKGEYIFLVPGHRLNLKNAPPPDEAQNPWQGLKPYDQAQASLFFGRDEATKTLAAQVSAQPFTVVVGASGTGKSSLVRAGLLPRLQTPELATQGGGWIVIAPFRPGENPLHALAQALAPLRTDEQTGRQPLELLHAWSTRTKQGRLLLVVDQYEELLTLAQSAQEREQFQNFLANALAQLGDRLRVVLTLRSDFEPHFMGDAMEEAAPLAPHWKHARFVVPPMSREELRQVIEGPASERALYFEPPELVDTLIDEVAQTPAALPLLSFMLSEMYVVYAKSNSDDRALTQEHYKQLGSVVGSLSKRATQEYESLPDEPHRESMRRVMVRMISREGGEVTRRRVPMHELDFPDTDENKRVERVLRQLENARLLVSAGSDLDRDGTQDIFVEPAHDALVRAWDLLLDWHRQAEAELPLAVRRAVTQDAEEWLRKGKLASLLWHNNVRLPQLQQLLTRQSQKPDMLDYLHEPQRTFTPEVTTTEPTWFNRIETEFVIASILQQGRNLRRLWLTTIGVIVVLSILSLVAWNQRNAAVEAEVTAVANEKEAIRLGVTGRRALARDLSAQTRNILAQDAPDHDLALLLALEAITATQRFDGYVHPNATDAALRAIEASPPWLMNLPRQRHTAPVTSAAFSPNGSKIVTASEDGTAKVWDANGVWLQTLSSRGCDATGRCGLTSARFSPDGTLIATVGYDGSFRLWETESGIEKLALAQQEQPIYSVQFSPDGQQIVTAGEDGIVHLWRVTNGAEIQSLSAHTDTVVSVAFSPDGTQIATASRDGTAKLWNVETGELERILERDQSEMSSISWSADGEQLVTTSHDETSNAGDEILWNAIVWNAKNGRAVRTVRMPACTSPSGCALAAAAFSPDGKWIVTASDDGSARLWDLATGRESRTLQGHRLGVNSAAFSPNGELILTAGNDHTARLWEAATGNELMTLHGHGCGQAFSSCINWVDISSDGQIMATAGEDGTAKVWNVVSGAELSTLRGHGCDNLGNCGVRSVDLNRDGSLLLTGGLDGTARIWDVASARQVLSVQADPRWVLSVALHPDGASL